MDYDKFRSRFQGSFRTKNLNQPLEPTLNKTMSNRRTFFQRLVSELPPEFIRQDPWEAEYLYMVAARARLGIVEIGRYNGGSAVLMACANEVVQIYSIDIEPQDDDFLRNVLAKENIGGNLNLIVGDSQNSKYPEIGNFDVLFIDGDHTYEGCTRDLENWYPDLEPGGHLLLHDSYHGCPVMDSCIDFMGRHNPIVHVSPFKHRNHSHHPAGSLAHFQKPRLAPASDTEAGAEQAAV